MASLTGQLVAETYKALLKLIDNDILTASEKQITDGFGGGSNVFIDSQGFLRANKYKVTNGLATQFLKADGSLDSNAYLTSITGAQVITALGYTPVPTTRTITINGETHNLAADNSWTVAGTAAIWGNITGTLSNQTDLQNALNAKYNNPAGTISQYIRGDGTLATFPTMPGGLPTGGSAGQILAKIDATDYNTHWIDNYATQTKNEVKLGQTLTKGTPVYVSSANGTNMIVSAASNTSEALSSKTFGLLETGGATNDLVKCVTFGLLAGLDTSAASAGDPVWLGPNGTLIYGLVNKPYAPAHLVYIGVVTRVQSNNGEIFVNVQNGFELKEIHDVYIADPANNHGLFYDIADGLWKNKSIATALGYTPQAQLSGTGFVKASGTTITYDNSTYLTTADAASTYQRLDKMVSNLLASDTEYPNSNAVIAALALKANAANPVFTGNMTISGAEPKLYFTDTDQNPDYFIGVDAGFFRVYDQTAGATRFLINSDGNISTGTGKSITAGSFIKDGGTATQFLKADGSVDATDYATVASLANYLLSTTAASTYQRLDKMVSNLLPSDTEYPNSNAVLAKLALKADAANPVFTGNMTISGAEPTLYFTDTDQNPDYKVFVDAGYFKIYDQTAGATRFQINSDGNISAGVGKSITAGSFIKESGTASQYLMADGSVSTLSGLVTGSGTTNYLPKWTSASVLGNSIVTDNGSNVGIAGSLNVTSSASTGFIRVGGGNGIGESRVYIEANGNLSYIDSYGDNGYKPLQINASQIGMNAGNLIVGGTSTTFKFEAVGIVAFGAVGNVIYTKSNGTTYSRFLNSGGNANVVYTGNSTANSGAFGINNFEDTVRLFNILNTGDATFANSVTSSNAFRALNAYGFTSYNGTTASGANIQFTASYFGGFDGIYQSSGSTNHFGIWTNGGTSTQGKFYIRNNGNVLIGTSTDSGYKLDVNGTSCFTNTLTIGNFDTLALRLQSGTPTGSSYLRFFNSAGTARGYLGLFWSGSADYMVYDAGALEMNLNSSNKFTFTGGGTATFSGQLNLNQDNIWVRNPTNTFYRGIVLGATVADGTEYAYIKYQPQSGQLVFFGSPSGFGGNTIFQNNASTWLSVNSSNNLSFTGTATFSSTILASSNIETQGRFIVQTAQSPSAPGQIGYGGDAGLYLWPKAGATYAFTLYSNTGNEAMRILTGSTNVNFPGRLGINQLSPSCYVDINLGFGGSNGTSAIKIGGLGNYDSFEMGIFGSYDAMIRTYGNDIRYYAGHWRSMGAVASENHSHFWFTSKAGSSDWSTIKMTLDHNANLTVLGSVYATAFYESSDKRLKKLIESNPIIDGIEKLEAKLYEKNGKIELGYFAQDAELIMPYAVTKNDEGFLNLSYREIHTAKIARLEKEFAELKAQLNLN